MDLACGGSHDLPDLTKVYEASAALADSKARKLYSSTLFLVSDAVC